MLKLYKLTGGKKEYWETWERDDASHIVHWGDLGTKGDSKIVKGSFLSKPEKIIQKEIDKINADGFRPLEGQFTLMSEYSIDGDFPTEDELNKRNRLMERMDETLGWTGLGNCEGASNGSGTMELCLYVVDFEIAKETIQLDLKGTEFDDFTRIYEETAG